MNKEIKEAIRKSGIPQYEIARRCGVAEWTLCRWLRYELSEDRRQRIMEAIEKGGQNHGESENS